MAGTMYLSLLLVLLGTIASLAALTRKYLLNTVTMICGMWFASALLASFRWNDMIPYSERVYGIIALGCAGVAAGDLFTRLLTQRVYGKTKNTPAIYENNAYSLNMRAILCFQVFCTAYYLWMCLKSVQLLHEGQTFADIRTQYQGYAGTESTLSNLELAIGNHIAKSFIFVMMPTALVILFTRKAVRYRRTALALTALDLLLYSLYTAGRIILLVGLFDALILISLYKENINKRTVVIAKRIGWMACAAIFFISIFRVTDHGNWGIWKTVYAYVSTPVALMSHWIERIDASVRPMNGMALSNGLFDVLDIFLKRLAITFPSHRECKEIISAFETFVPVYGGNKINAFVSAFTYFYLDGRETGVFLFSALTGMAGCFFEERALKKPDLLSLLTYMLLMQAIVKFLFKWEFASSGYVLAFVYLRVIFVRRGRWCWRRGGGMPGTLPLAPLK